MTDQIVGDTHHYAGFWVRFMACVIDLIVYTPFYLAMKWAAGDHKYWAEGVFMVFALFSYAWFFASKWQGSPGMHVMHIHIQTVDGQRLSWLHAFVWSLVGTIGWVLCFAGIIYLQARFDLEAINNYLNQVATSGQPLQLDDPTLHQLTGMDPIDYSTLVLVVVAVTIILCIIWALSVAIPKNKSGFHNVICKTRFINRRP